MNEVEARFRGLTVLVVEDEFAVLLMLEDMLQQLGCSLTGSASRIPDAMRMIGEQLPDVALLDVNLAGEPIYPLAEVLAERNVPIVFSTGYGFSGLAAAWRGRVVLQKPFEIGELAAALLLATGR